ncbi:hypothetical protein ACFHWD_16350 [Clostridium sp. MT-14]
MLEFTIPDSKEKIEKTIKALEWQLQHDTSQKDIDIHTQALKCLKSAL